MRKIKLDPAVYDDLKLIHDWIAEDSPINAIRFVRRLVETINQLDQVDMPGVARDDLLPGIRRVNVEKYAILIRLPNDEIIEVLQVIHGSRDIPRHIRDSDQPLQ